MKASKLPALLLALFSVYLLAELRSPSYESGFDVNGFARLPVLNGGRVKPLDTIARTFLLMIHGKQTLRSGRKRKDAVQWLMDVLFDPAKAESDPLFEIDDPEVLGMFGIQQTKNRYYAFTDLAPFAGEIEKQAVKADEVKPEQRSRFQRSVHKLQSRLILFQSLGDTFQLLGGGASAEFYAKISEAYRAGEPQGFNLALKGLQQAVAESAPQENSRAGYERLFNVFQPFYQCVILYMVVFLLTFLSRMFWPEALYRSAFWLLLLAFGLHTVGLSARMWIQARPPVTNLYSSAIFVGWFSVLMGVVLEKITKRGLGSIAASAIGFITLIIAHNLASEGDTLEMMRAVLDSNFWLATHVVCITIGYASTFLSGFLGILYVLRRIFDKRWDEGTASALEGMIYGVVCFSAFFSFLGTVLGGIWADQSWGRFWGWDPKENGALMIVLWNVFILHARIGGLASQRSIALMAVFGNVITAVSWFGVNMLGIGLHSYGFMDQAFVWLAIFCASQFAVIGLGMVPEPVLRAWRNP
ncbi:MAG: hypothetical protein A3A86_03220 [Elusimicrobia bacterium RIFCSPLOWO2_01_FULL_60_11]|nr:MAG: hypothetical protein A3A86_03220 [Elusimicrobia bacterium RIFCSPLOWO2_01_FULL_60_11]